VLLQPAPARAFQEFKQLAAAVGVVPPKSALGAVDLDALESLSAGVAPQQRVVQLLPCVQKLGAVRMEPFSMSCWEVLKLLGAFLVEQRVEQVVLRVGARAVFFEPSQCCAAAAVALDPSTRVQAFDAEAATSVVLVGGGGR
jgi:hypothetical protein